MKLKISKSKWNSLNKVSQFNRPEYKYSGQNFNPEASDFMVDISDKDVTLPAGVKSKINNAIHKLGSYFPEIPLDQYREILKNNDCCLIMEDGTIWQGIMFAPICGSSNAQNGHAILRIAYKMPDMQYHRTKQCLSMSSCRSEDKKMNPIECIAYIS